jgi:flagellar motor switch protein FliN/FliY
MATTEETTINNDQPATAETDTKSKPSPRPDSKGNLEFLFDVPLKVSVEVGRALLVIKDLLQMKEGYVIELDKAAGEPLDLYVNSRLIARGEAVLVNDKFGIRLTEVVSPSERLEKLG